MSKEKSSVKDMTIVGSFAALLAILSQIMITIPGLGVPLTLQTFSVALTGRILGWKKGSLSILIYILIGLIGIPVFAGFGAGPQTLLGKSGGFIIGFLPLSAFCGIFKKVKPVANVMLSLLGLILCHAIGTIQFSFIMDMEIIPSFLMVSLPFLVKDGICVLAALGIGKLVRKRFISSQIRI
ncbi:MAG TPA: biotin transporter BioY [Candidatus Merdenecus merdavium]|nr:biotin transporter BioY [Candidatus Merdenecus merdavium]